MFIISFSQLFLYDHSQGVIIIFLPPPLAPRWRSSLFIPYYIRVCKSKTYLILKNIFNRVQN